MTDEELMSAYQLTRSAVVFAELHRRLQGRVTRYARDYMYSSYHSSIEDAVQEVFLKLHKAADQYTPGEPFLPWFYKIIMSESRRVVKKEKRFRRTQSLCEDLDLLVNADSRPPGVMEIVDNLPPEERQMIQEVYFEHRCIRKAAVAAGVNAVTYYKRLQRILRMLRDQLSRQSL